MDERAIGRADDDRRVTAFGKQPDAPARDTPSPSIQQPSMHDWGGVRPGP
jgi:hypothetical protein